MTKNLDIYTYIKLLDSGFRVTGCHTQALYSSCSELDRLISPYIFEACTTVPFGISHVANDPNRILDSITDPDNGLDIACNAIGIDYKSKFFKNINEFDKVLDELNKMIPEGPVVAGPLDMGMLPYFKNCHQYLGIDHYIVIYSINLIKQTFTIVDPERFGSVVLDIEDLLAAWSAISIREGRGMFSMRQITSVPNKVDWDNCFDILSPIIYTNLDSMSSLYLLSFNELSQKFILKENERSYWNGLQFCLNNRVRRILTCCSLIVNYKNCSKEKINLLLKTADEVIKLYINTIQQVRSRNELNFSFIRYLIDIEISFGKIIERVL